MMVDRRHTGSAEPREPIAVIGIGCRFPGDANDPESFWNLLATGQDAISSVPESRFNIGAYYHPSPGTPGKTYSRWGGFLRSIDEFEPECFGISPREAAYIDPQQRLLLEATWEALEDGGQVIDQLTGSKIGVFIGLSTTDYAQIQSSPRDQRTLAVHSATGGAASIAAGRISYCLNLQGPSLVVDTACSSSLVATHLACQSIWNGESDMALAGGVNVIIIPQNFIGFCAATMLSPDGRCKAFDASANGFVRGEGAGVVAMKPLSQAQRDGDRIYALIAATAVNQDGRTGGIAAPSQTAQEALLREACSQAGIAPHEIQYMEAHGTGTAVGDPIETHGLGAVLSPGRSTTSPCIIGSVKTNIGHLEAGAGIAGLIKTTLALNHRIIPPNLHFRTPNPMIPFEDLQLRVATAPEPWPDPDKPAIAGVNSFGFGGTNAHVLMKGYGDAAPPLSPPETEPEQRPVVLPLSARTPEALQTLAQSYSTFLSDEAHANLALNDVSFSAGTRRMPFDHRLTLVARSRSELCDYLNAFSNDEKRPAMTVGRRIPGHQPKVVFVCSGQGPQWWGMGRQLLETEPVFRAMIERCDTLLQDHADWSLLTELTRDEDHTRVHETAIAQPTIFALQVALAGLWKSYGIVPEAVVGHSVGEVAAAHLSGALSLPDAIRVIYYRGACMDRPTSEGKMLAVGLPWTEAEALIQDYRDCVSIGAINSPSATALSGDPQALEAIADTLNTRDIFSRFLPVRYAFHSPRMESIKDELLSALGTLNLNPTAIPMISTVSGEPVEGQHLTSVYWWRNVRQSVRFADAMMWLGENDAELFVELSPHPVLAGSIAECLAHQGRKGMALPSLRQRDDEQVVMLSSLGALFTQGYPVDWRHLHETPGRCVTLPSYPWQRQAYWHESEDVKGFRVHRASSALLGRDLHAASPSWEVVADRQVFNYLADHKIREEVVFPASAYVEMAIGAAHESLGEGMILIEELQFQRALFIPESNEAPTVQLISDAADGSFTIHSSTSTSDATWILHTIGYLRRQHALQAPQTIDLATIRQTMTDEIAPEAFYLTFADIGLPYGPAFQGVQAIWRRDREALGRVRLGDDLTTVDQHYHVHPALLDACFQLSLGAMPEDIRTTNRSLYLPLQIERVRFHSAPSQEVWCHVTLTLANANAFEADLCICDSDGNVAIEVEGFRCQAIGQFQGDDSQSMDNWWYGLNWVNRPLPDHESATLDAEFLTRPTDLAKMIEADLGQVVSSLDVLPTMPAAEEALDHMAAAYIVQALRRLGWEGQAGDDITPASLISKLGVIPAYHPFMRRLLLLLEKTGYLTRQDTATWIVSPGSAFDSPHALWHRALLKYPAFFAELTLLERCGEQLADVLHGRIEPPAQLLPSEGLSDIIDHWYQDSPRFRLANMIAAKAVVQSLHTLPLGRTARILEIGAGRGGLTTYVLPRLPEHQTAYTVSDKDAMLVEQAEQNFRDYPFVDVTILDIEQSPAEQGYTPHTFDVILVSEALHSISNRDQALSHIQELLTSHGLLILMERGQITPSWLDLIWGWTQEGSYTLEAEQPATDASRMPLDWKSLLDLNGFEDIADLSQPMGQTEPFHVVMVARGPQVDPSVEVINSNTGAEQDRPGCWLMFADQSDVASRLTQQLEAGGETVVRVTPGETYRALAPMAYEISRHEPGDLMRLLQDVYESYDSNWRGVIHFWALDTPTADGLSAEALQSAEELGCYTIMSLIQAYYKLPSPTPTPQIVLVTQNAQPVGQSQAEIAIGQAPLIGIGRTLISEYPDLRCKLVDLDAEISPEMIQALYAELHTDDPEEEIALRPGARFAPRLDRMPTAQVPVQTETVETADKRPFRLEIATPGVIDNLTLQESKRRPPGPGQVEIEVYAAALNFRDVMKTLGLYPTDGDDYLLLGDECAGRIVAVGEDVYAFEVGDDVVAIAPACFGAYVTTEAALLMRKLTHLTYEEAVTIPVTFLTAYYALHQLAQLQPGERVLIQAAAGGVGLAALQIAQHAGAEVFATAGSPEKRRLLHALGVEHVMDSRSLTFADDIMEITQGQGVDIVLNSLAGQAIWKGLACLAPYGRFLELGKRDIYQNSKVGLWAFRKNVSLFAIDLSRVLTDKPTLVKSLMEDLAAHLNAGHYAPLPHRTFPVTRIAEAFRHLAQARHIGKVVISMREPDIWVEAATPPKMNFRSDATYLITGGFGGLGSAMAQWIVDNGGRHLVLMSRSGAATDEARHLLEALQQSGAQVVVAKADVTQAADVARVIEDIDQSMPPLRGVFHAAMVLDDGALLQLDRQRFHQVTAPKVEGTWNLHDQTQDHPLDFFVLFSSASSLFGNQGQANYVAANLFQDNFAAYRRAIGLPAMTLNWGHVTEVGYVARHDDVGELLTNRGVLGLSPQQAMDALGYMLQRNPVQMGVMRMDWQRLAQSASQAGFPQRFTALIGSQFGESQAGEEGNQIRDALLNASPEEQAEIVQTYIRDQVARVLGIAPDRLDADRPLSELGLDSLMAVELKNRVETTLALSVPTRILLEGPSINRLAEVLIDQQKVSGADPQAPSAEEAKLTEELSARVDQLSDDEVDAFLRELVGNEVEEFNAAGEETKG